jgi:uncharacterized protein (TIGR02118 family)
MKPQTRHTTTSEVRRMIRVTALYPYSEGARFDMEYYASQHAGLVPDLLGDALKGGGAEKGVGSAEPGAPPPFIATGYMEFESVDAFEAAFGPNAEAIMGDVPNYTDIAPISQVAEIVG